LTSRQKREKTFYAFLNINLQDGPFMEPDEAKSRLSICIFLLLAVAWIFSMKSCVDNRIGVSYAGELEKIFNQMNQGTTLKDKRDIITERDNLQKKLADAYRFPKIFFFFFVLVAVGLGTWGAILISKLPEDSRIRKQISIAFVISLVTFAFVLLIFFLMEYHHIVRLGWVLFSLIVQWMLIGLSAALYFSTNFYETLLGLKQDKNIIQGPPPPAWE